MNKLLAILSCILFYACTSDKEIAGASTVETENACIINVVGLDSKPVSNAMAKVRPLWYVQSTALSSHDEVVEFIADSLGNITLDAEKFSNGYIEVIDNNTGVFQQIHADTLIKNKVTSLQLQALGSVTGKADLPQNASYAWVQIYGTDKLVKTNEKGGFTLDSLPPASYQIRAILSDDQDAIGEGSVQVTAGKSSKIETLEKPSLDNERLEQWAHSRTIPLDSTISEWMRPIADTTVVFVRLNPENFKFSEAMKNGNDIRFTDQDGKRLDFKKAFWNDSLQNAEFQIRINGTSSVESLIMYWGKTAALDASNNDIWNTLPDSLVQAIHSIKLIDFESLKLESSFSYADATREWYFEPQDSNVTTTPSKDNAAEAFEKSDERNGYVFHWKSTSKKKGKWSMIGTRLNRIPSSLEGIDSIAFYAKGSGELGFAIEVLDEPTGKTKYVDYLDSNWKRFSWTPKDFVPGDGEFGNMGWDFVRPRVTTITIWIVDDSEMWIDDVILYGVNRDNLN